MIPDKIQYDDKSYMISTLYIYIPKFIVWGHHHPDTKTIQRYYRKDIYRLISLMNTDAKISTKYSKTESNSILRGSHTKVGFLSGMQGLFSIHKSIEVIYHINKLTHENHMIISIVVEKAFEKNPTPIYDTHTKKTSPESGHRGNIHQHNKGRIWQTHRKHHSPWWKTEHLPSDIIPCSFCFKLGSSVSRLWRHANPYAGSLMGVSLRSGLETD